MRYEDVLNAASELYAVMDALISYYYAVHREADGLVVTAAKMAVQKHLEVPTVLIREPLVIQILPPVEEPFPGDGYVFRQKQKSAPPVDVPPEPEPEPALVVAPVVRKPAVKRNHRRK